MSKKEDHFVFACLDIYVSVNMGKQEKRILVSKTWKKIVSVEDN